MLIAARRPRVPGLLVQVLQAKTPEGRNLSDITYIHSYLRKLLPNKCGMRRLCSLVTLTFLIPAFLGQFVTSCFHTLSTLFLGYAFY